MCYLIHVKDAEFITDVRQPTDNVVPIRRVVRGRKVFDRLLQTLNGKAERFLDVGRKFDQPIATFGLDVTLDSVDDVGLGLRLGRVVLIDVTDDV